MTCKLYCANDEVQCQLGIFRNRKKAEEFWKAIRVPLTEKLGHIKPIYVETGKGRKNNG